MNTRTFIWGLILFFLSGIGIASKIIEIQSGEFHGFWDWLVMVLSVITIIDAWIKIDRTTL